MVFCSRCGREGAVGQLYCTECGTKIIIGDTVEQRTEVEDLHKKYEGARAMHDSLFKDFTNLKREYQKINLEKSNLSTELQRSESELKKVIETYRSLEIMFKEKSEKLGSIEQQYQALQSREAQVGKAHSELVPKYNDAIKERDVARAECDRLKHTYADEIEKARRAGAEDKEKARRALQTERDDLSRNYEALRKEHEHVISEKADLNTALQGSRTDLKKMTEVRQELEEALKKLEASTKERGEKLSSIEKQYQTLQSKEQQTSKAYNEMVPKYNDAIKERDLYRKGIAEYKKDQEEIAKLRGLVKAYEGLQGKYDELDETHRAVLAERDGLRVELENSKAIFERELEGSKDMYDEEHRKYASLEQENRALLETYAELSKKSEDTEKELEGLRSDHELQKQAVRDLELRIKVTSEKLNETERQHRDLLLQHLELTSSYERLLGAAKQAMREREQIKVSSKAGADQAGPKETRTQEVKPEGLKTIIRTNPEKKED